MTTSVRAGSAEDVSALRGLWPQMLAHHRDLLDGLAPGTPDDRSWAATATDYRSWLERDEGLLLLAHGDDGALLGSLACRIEPSGRTVDLGRHGNVDSLVVTDATRGRGVGSQLLDACRSALLARGTRFWTIGVVAGNEGASALHARPRGVTAHPLYTSTRTPETRRRAGNPFGHRMRRCSAHDCATNISSKDHSDRSHSVRHPRQRSPLHATQRSEGAPRRVDARQPRPAGGSPEL
jgi:GNAT superfamily N-acetyltransferase